LIIEHYTKNYHKNISKKKNFFSLKYFSKAKKKFSIPKKKIKAPKSINYLEAFSVFLIFLSLNLR
jgi:hypothetical protein